MTNSETLAARIEAAGVDEQRVMLCAAFQFLRGATASANEFRSDNPKPGSFHAKLNAGAYLDAAMMLVPEGWRPYKLDMSVIGRCWWMIEGPKTKWVKDEDGYDAAGDDWFVQGIAATPALALAAAAIRAGGV